MTARPEQEITAAVRDLRQRIADALGASSDHVTVRVSTDLPHEWTLIEAKIELFGYER